MGLSFSSEEQQPDFKKYGSIMEVATSGASQRTANQDNLGYKGIEASDKMAETDSWRMREYRYIIETVGRRYDVDPALIAAIVSRESRAGNTIRASSGWGDWSPRRNAFNAFGLMQVDVNPDGGAHDPEGKWDSEDHVDQGTRILVHFIKKIQKTFPDWSKEQQLKGGIAAYNMGNGNVHSYNNVDENTTGGDYSNDVVARAKWYKKNGDQWCRLNWV